MCVCVSKPSFHSIWKVKNNKTGKNNNKRYFDYSLLPVSHAHHLLNKSFSSAFRVLVVVATNKNNKFDQKKFSLFFAKTNYNIVHRNREGTTSFRSEQSQNILTVCFSALGCDSHDSHAKSTTIENIFLLRNFSFPMRTEFGGSKRVTFFFLLQHFRSLRGLQWQIWWTLLNLQTIFENKFLSNNQSRRSRQSL